MLRVAIIGCGKIADQHVLAIRRIAECELVALCDREILMASQLGERFGISDCFSDAAEMLRCATPDVVHITTPPQSHFPLAQLCLQSGCHVYLEKPFTVTAREAEALIELAEKLDLKLTAGHNLQFTLEMIEMREWVARGFLGGKPVHLESHFSYSLDDATYIGPVLGSPNHWVRKLPGQLLHNILSHPVAKLAEFLDEDLDEITAIAHQSPKLAALGGREVLDELRVMIRDKSGTTALLCFSTQFRPGMNQLRILGLANSVVVDHASGCVVRLANRPAKSYLTYFLPPMRMCARHLCGALRNLKAFLKQRLHQDFGMRELVGRFYDSIRSNLAPPLPYREILLTAKIMDSIFAQIYSSRKPIGVTPPHARPEPSPAVSS